MIQVITTLRVQKGCADKFLQLAEPLVKVGQKNKGNLFFHLSQSEDDPMEMVFLENWKDQASSDAHKATDEFNTICPKLLDLCDGEMHGTVYHTDL